MTGVPAQPAPGDTIGMEKDGVRVCDGCGQRIPTMSKLATKESDRDLCLACQIREAQIHKGLRH